MIVLILVGMVSFFVNTPVVCVMVSKKNLRTKSNLLFLPILLNSYLIITVTILDTVQILKLNTNLNVSTASVYLTIICFVSSSLLICLTSAYRAINIHSNKKIGHRNLFFLVTIIYIIALSTPLLFGRLYSTGRAEGIVIFISLGLAVFFSLMFMSYIVIWYQFRKSTKNLRQLEDPMTLVNRNYHTDSFRNVRSKKLIKTISIILIAYVLFNMTATMRAFTIIHQYFKPQFYLHNKKFIPCMEIAGELLIAMGTIVNPLIYCYRNKDIYSAIFK